MKGREGVPNLYNQTVSIIEAEGHGPSLINLFGPRLQ